MSRLHRWAFISLDEWPKTASVWTIFWRALLLSPLQILLFSIAVCILFVLYGITWLLSPPESESQELP